MQAIQAQAKQDAVQHKYHNLIPGQKSPEEFRVSSRFWQDVFEDYPDLDNPGQNAYKEAWLTAYQQEWDDYWRGGD